MFIPFMICKIHRATVTDADLNYIGSISIDSEIMEAAGLKASQKVEIYNITNGDRFSTYMIAEEKGSKKIGINGAAHLAAREIKSSSRSMLSSMKRRFPLEIPSF